MNEESKPSVSYLVQQEERSQTQFVEENPPASRLSSVNSVTSSEFRLTFFLKQKTGVFFFVSRLTNSDLLA